MCNLFHLRIRTQSSFAKFSFAAASVVWQPNPQEWAHHETVHRLNSSTPGGCWDQLCLLHFSPVISSELRPNQCFKGWWDEWTAVCVYDQGQSWSEVTVQVAFSWTSKPPGPWFESRQFLRGNSCWRWNRGCCGRGTDSHLPTDQSDHWKERVWS